ncbi:MAG: flagellar filament capping protein FliD [Clostridia bacterium]|nr:flagellar filament capping protein FliD [Clostridia bacterium]
MTDRMRISGLSTGYDTTAVIDQLMAIERRPVLQMQQKQNKIKSRADAWRDIATRLSALKTRATSLKSAATINAKSASTSSASVVAATASAGAANGVHKVWVDRMATSTKIVANGQLGRALEVGAKLAEAGFSTAPTVGAFTVSGKVIRIDSDTVMSDGVDNAGSNSILGKINNSGAGAIASMENNRLVLRSASGQIRLGSGADTSNFLTAAKLLGAGNSAMVTSGVAEHATEVGKIAADVASGAKITFSYRGNSYTTDSADITGGAAGVTSVTDMASQIEAALNKAIGAAGSVKVSASDGLGGGAQAGDGRFVITDSATDGTLSFSQVTDAGLGSLLESGGATSGAMMASFGNLGTTKTTAALSKARLGVDLMDSATGGVAEGDTEGKLAAALEGTETVKFVYHGTEYTTAALAAGDDMQAVAADLEARMNEAAGLEAGTIRVRTAGINGSKNDMFVVTDTATPVGSTSNSITIGDAPGALKLGAGDGATNKGVFLVNGVAIKYDKYSDAVNDILNRINSSTANVAAAYDALNDRISLTAKYTGEIAVALDDVGGNFLGAARVLGAEQDYGDNALYRIDTVNGGQQMSSASNTISGVITNVNLTLKEISKDPVTVTVSQNVDAGYGAIKSFVDQYNSVMDMISTLTAYDKDTRTAGALQGNSSVRGIQTRLRQMVSTAVDGLPEGVDSLLAIGISTGAVGQANGKSNALTIDDAKLKRLLETDSDTVAQVFNSANGGISGLFEKYVDELVKGGTGLISKTQGLLKDQTRDVDNRIKDMETRLARKRENLVNQFTQMEKVLSSMQQQQSWMTSQFNSMGI